MAVMAIFSGKGFTKELYEKLRQEVGWETDPIDGWKCTLSDLASLEIST